MTANAIANQMEVAYTTAVRYDLNGRVTGTIAPDPDATGPLRLLATRNTYNSRGLLIRVESGELSTWLDETITPASWTNYGYAIFLTREFTFDSYGRRLTESVKGANGAVESLVQYTYDVDSRVQCQATRMNPSTFAALPTSACDQGTAGSFGPDRISRFTYDQLDQVLTEERGVGTSLAQAYVTNTYTNRFLTSQTDANGNRTELRPDSYKRVSRRVFPSPTTAGTVNEADYNEYTYDANGNVLTERKRNGTLITNTYDKNNRLVLKDLSNNTYSADVYSNYDLRGLLLYARFTSDSGQGVTNSFDGFGNLLTSTTNMGGVSRALSYRYDDNGNRTRVTHPDGWFFAYGFDGLNRLNSLAESASATPTAATSTLLTVSYRTNGGRLSISRAGGVSSTTFTPDNANRLRTFAQDFPGTAADLTNTFSYNPANQITQLIQSNTQYTNVGNQSRGGNYMPNGLNQYTNIGGVAFTYDTNGNLTSDGSRTYTYDMENRLVATAGSPVSTLTYDPLGRLFQVTITGVSTQFLYDGDALVAEYSSAGAVTRRYVHGDQVDEPLVQYSGASVGATYRRFLHADHQGSIIAQSDNTGAVLNKLAYDVFGGPAFANVDRFGYTGQAWIKELGLFYYKARMYSYGIGRFLQTDPVGYKDDFNLYAYVGNDPLDRIDPKGLSGCKSGDKEFATCTITIVYDKRTSKGTLTVTGENKGDKGPTTLLTTNVVVGGDGHATPTGTFTASYWEKDHVSKKYGSWADTPYSKTKLGGNAFGPYQLHIKELDKRGIYIHGTMGPSWNRSTIFNSLVSPTSHGCVRMCNADNIVLHKLMPDPAGNMININTRQEEE